MTDDREQRLRQKVQALPATPGVYLMKDARGRVIYVGKAARLVHRVRNYFGPEESLDPKTRTLVRNIADFDYVVTPTEKDALLLESQLVKENKPRYNVRLKDDKRFPYLRLTSHEAFPRIDIVRQPQADGCDYYGPYTDAKAMRLTLKTLTQLFPIRTCTLKLPEETVPRPCLDYYIHRCCAPCVDYVDQPEYADLVERVRLFLSGRSNDLIRDLEARMDEHSGALRFEDAARVRDTLTAVRKVVAKQELVLEPGEDVDVLGLEREGRSACGVVLRVRDGKLIQTENYFFRSGLDDDESDFFRRFAAETFDRSREAGGTILLMQELEDAATWEQALLEKHGHVVRLHVPQRGRKARLVEVARTNARHKLRELLARTVSTKSTSNEDIPEVLDLKRRLDLPVAPHSIECFDMSHFQGSQRVGSLVYFSAGQPLKSRYRRFKIQRVEGIDDFAMMQECLERYYSRLRDEDQLPADLVVVDGGAGQLGVAVRTLHRYGFVETAVIGLAKREEEVYVPGGAEPIRLPRSAPGLKLLQRIRDEAHRFAITFHRQLRDKETLHSVLDDIPGVGQVKKRALLTHFGSADAVGKASLEQLTAVPSIGPADARRIVEFFLGRAPS